MLFIYSQLERQPALFSPEFDVLSDHKYLTSLLSRVCVTVLLLSAVEVCSKLCDTLPVHIE